MKKNKMLVFAADTATEYLNLALCENGKVLSEVSFRNQGTHSKNIIQNIDYCYSLAQKKIADTDLFAAGTGPGNFTGVRIGVSILKGMSYPLKKPLTGVSSLDAAAWAFRYSDKIILSVTDARRQEVYYAFYRFKNGVLSEKTPERVARPENIKEYSNEEIIITGSGAYVYSDLFDLLFAKVYYPPFWMTESKPQAICEIAEEKYLKNKTDETFGIVPNYIRRSNAEEAK
jgi:tRNA threonylcarbamoyladenosine biosynthesis protein TsaB